MSHLPEQLEQRPQVRSEARDNTQEADTRQSLFEGAYGVGGGVGHLLKDGMNNKVERSNNGSKNEQDCVTELDFGADPFAAQSAKNSHATFRSPESYATTPSTTTMNATTNIRSVWKQDRVDMFKRKDESKEPNQIRPPKI